MISSFKDKRLAQLFETGKCKRLPVEHIAKIENILGALAEAGAIEDMARPSFHLHALEGDREGFWSVTVRANWRIVFRFADGEASDVEYIDYH